LTFLDGFLILQALCGIALGALAVLLLRRIALHDG